ncbi:arginase family protein [Jidongwangia harbinensis]|uniref:arginase family protein n=1 Tax=Jidongwangia harbinensis TaxID=2878561 RepID=UPI001CD940CF|nr:arginase family protein [Jidongwangia harbinensis]MCA2217793.1 arginase family protein [Jidongwangia harbinensis]
MAILVVPYHQDQRLADDVIPLSSGGEFLVLDPHLPDGDRWPRLAALHHAVAEQVAAAVRAGVPTTVLSGDCLIAVGVLAGAQRGGVHPAMVWFDAHGDVHTLETTTSGYLGGLSLRLALGAHPELLARPLGLQPLTEDRTVLVDARDLDPAEADYLAGSAVRRTTAADLDAATLPAGPLILHVDVDVVDAAEMPGLLFPAPGGPSTSEVVAAVRRVQDTGRVTVLDVACPWRPTEVEKVRRTRSDLLRALTAGQAVRPS